AVGISPLTTTARIWEERSWKPYRIFLESHGFPDPASFQDVIRDDYMMSPDLPLKDPHNILIIYMPQDNASTTQQIKEFSEAWGGVRLVEVDAAHSKHPHETGLIPVFASLFEDIVSHLAR